MSSTPSSSWTSSSAEQTIFDYEDDFVPQSNTTDRTSARNSNIFSYDPTSAYDLQRRTNAAIAGVNLDIPVNHVRIEERADFFSELSDQTYSHTYRADDKDWPILFPSAQALPSFNNSDFNSDADASLNPETPTHSAQTNIAILTDDAVFDDSLYDYTEHIDYTDIEEVFNNFDIRSQATELEQFIHQEDLLQDWQYDYQRHEWVALKFQLPPYTTERQ